MTADLDGRVIAVSEIPDWYCHDLDYPRIHCFRSPAALKHALATRQSTDLAASPAASATYLHVYVDANFSGGYTVISQAYDDLRTIGWNDRISSFRAVNGIAGHFATDIYNSGAYYYFGPNQQTTYVGDAWNAAAHGLVASVVPGLDLGPGNPVPATIPVRDIATDRVVARAECPHSSIVDSARGGDDRLAEYW